VELEDVYAALTAPFAPDVVELKPGATNKEKTKACAMAYVSVWEYRRRLNEIVGAGNWSQELRMLDANTMLCRLTVLGAVREEVGEEAESEEQRADNTSCNRAAQAFKRACAAMGLGLYLYDLPQKWLEFDGQRRRFAESVDLQRVVLDLYRQAGIQWPPKKATPSPFPGLVSAIRAASTELALDAIASQAKEHRKAGLLTREQLETLGRESVLRREALRGEDDFFTNPTPDDQKKKINPDHGAHHLKQSGTKDPDPAPAPRSKAWRQHSDDLTDLARLGKNACPAPEKEALDAFLHALLGAEDARALGVVEGEALKTRWTEKGEAVVAQLLSAHRDFLAGAK
jgi:hypothetical protein